MRTHVLPSLLLLLLAVFIFPAHAETFIWKDKNGKTILSDRPPVETQSAQTVDDVDSGKSASKEDEQMRKIAQEEARARKKAESEKKLVAWRCDEMAKQKSEAETLYETLKATDTAKAAVLKTDIENYTDTIKRMCK